MFGKQAFNSMSRLVLGHTFKVLALIFIISIGVVLWHLEDLANEQVEQTAISNAEIYADVIKTFRALYTSEVVNVARNHGMVISHDYKAQDDAIPLPATFSMLMGKKIGDAGGVRSNLYSPYPFPWREISGGLSDDFSREAWQALKNNPERPYYRFEEVDGRASLRYAVADILQASCVECHNSHEQSPKTNWRIGEVRGVLEVVTPVSEHKALAVVMLKETAILSAIVFFISLGCVAVVLRRLRSINQDVSKQAESTAVTNQQLVEEIDARKVMEQKLEQMSLTDPLTGLGNRRHFEQILESEWKRALRNHLELTVILIDIDHFKLFNDEFGHPAGDECLKAVANALRQPLSRPADLVARYGGEEFIVVLPETSIEGGLKIAEAMRRKVELLAMPHANVAPTNVVTISLGVASARPEKSFSVDNLVATADQALYDAKHEGRNRVCIKEDVVVKLKNS